MPPTTSNSRRSLTFLPPLATVIAPAPETDATLNENAFGPPMWGFPRRLKRMRSWVFTSVAVPSVERGFVPSLSWSTMIAVVRPSRTSTSGLSRVGRKPCTKAEWVSLIIRCDSAAMVSRTSDDFPEPETPVNTVRRRFGRSMFTPCRLFSRAPRTRIRSWESAGWGIGMGLLGIVGRSARRAPPLRDPGRRVSETRQRRSSRVGGREFRSVPIAHHITHQRRSPGASAFRCRRCSGGYHCGCHRMGLRSPAAHRGALRLEHF